MPLIPSKLISHVKQGHTGAIAKSISLIENQSPGFEEILLQLQPDYSVPVIGITGNPGAGKSSLINTMLANLSKKGKKTAVVAVDPSSPFHLGALLGDRIRMNIHANDPNIYIRSLASRGNLGGLSAKSLEVTELLRAAPFDMIIVETVGVGQSEIEIAGLADITILITTPGTGDEVQFIKAGIMEIADIFIVNKSDTDPESEFYHKLVRNIKKPKAKKTPPVIRTSANSGEGIDELIQTIETFPAHTNIDKKATLLTIKTLQLIREIRTRNIDPDRIKEQVFRQLESGTFNLYRFANDWEGGIGE